VLLRLAVGFSMLAACVAVHGAMLALAFRRLAAHPVSGRLAFGAVIVRMIRLAAWIVVAHLVEITLWGLFYAWGGIFPDAESAFYFSAVTYTTVGYGDLLPPREWRLLAGVEGLTGILMCGWSTGFFFAFFNRLQPSQDAGRG
jgi:hypothetical protein